VTAGWRCLEVGAGGGSVARRLGERVGATGSVLALDLDTTYLADLPPHITVRRHDLTREQLPHGEFDLVTVAPPRAASSVAAGRRCR
jgi:tRNA A58 N-methylase Trm61